MKIEEYCRLMHVEFPDDVILAASYLQAKGLRFCMEFGYENAIQKAEELYRVSTRD
jgi:hypothetical protein